MDLDGRRNSCVSVKSVLTAHTSIRTFVSCYVVALLVTIVIVSGDDNFKDGIVVTESKFYLQKGEIQRISCKSLAATSNAILISWLRVTQTPDGNSTDLIVRWADSSLHGTNFSAGDRYQLTRDFSLVMKSVVGGDGGLYQCQKVSSIAAENTDSTVKVVVLDKQFPVARGVVRNGTNVKKQRGEEVNLPCPIKEASTVDKPTFYWSREVTGREAPTEIIAQVFSDGETAHSDDYRIAASNDLILSTLTSEKMQGYWCHVSSAPDKFYLRSGRVSLEVQDKPNLVAIYVLVPIILILLIILFVGVWKRDWIRNRFFPQKDRDYIPVPHDRDGPTINSGSQDKWVHEFNLDRKGKHYKPGREFASLKSVAVFNEQHLAVLDDTGVHIFSPDFDLLDKVSKLRQSPKNYITMVTHHDQRRLLLGAKNGEITCMGFKPCEDQESWFRSLSNETPGSEEDAGASSSTGKEVYEVASKDNPATTSSSPSETVPLTDTAHVLTGISVDRNGKIYAGNASNHSITILDPEGAVLNSFELQKLFPKILAARSAGEILVHSGDRGSPVFRIEVTGADVSKKVFIKGSDVLNPVNILVNNSSLLVISDTKCNGQMEIFQYDNKGNYQRQFATPWRGIRGLCMMESGNRLALYDNSIVRIYKKERLQTSTA